jgi:hypothetical protein
MTCLQQLLSEQYGTICSYYLHPNMYVSMTVFDNERF